MAALHSQVVANLNFMEIARDVNLSSQRVLLEWWGGVLEVWDEAML